MRLKFICFSLADNHCENFIGVKEHGTELVLTLSDETTFDFGINGEENANIHIYQDGTIYLTSLTFNFDNEEYEEKIEIDLTNNKQFKKDLSDWFKYKKIYQSRLFPYSIESCESIWGSKLIASNYDQLIDYLKAN